MLFSWHKVIAVMSITLKSSCITLLYDNSLYFLASIYFWGSLSYTPSTLVPFSNISEPNSFALKAAAESVVKNGFPVPPAMITILPFSICLIALLLM